MKHREELFIFIKPQRRVRKRRDEIKRRQLLELLGACRQQTGKADASSGRAQVNLNAIRILTDKIDNKNQANRRFGVGWERNESVTCSSCGWGPRL